jgi:hypothetical protein
MNDLELLVITQHILLINMVLEYSISLNHKLILAWILLMTETIYKKVKLIHIGKTQELRRYLKISYPGSANVMVQSQSEPDL